MFNFLINSSQFIFLLQLWDPLYRLEEDNPRNKGTRQKLTLLYALEFCEFWFRGLSSSERYSGSNNWSKKMIDYCYLGNWTSFKMLYNSLMYDFKLLWNVKLKWCNVFVAWMKVLGFVNFGLGGYLLQNGAEQWFTSTVTYTAVPTFLTVASDGAAS